MTGGANEGLAVELYQSLAQGDRQRLAELLHPDFEGRTTEGLPLGLGGTYHGPDAMRRDFWGRIAKSFDARAEPVEFHPLPDGRLMVVGRYVGEARATGRKLNADFMHVLSFADGRICGLTQLTDSGRWAEALAGDSGTTSGALATVELTVSDGLAVVRLNRPEAGNGINEALVDDLYEIAQRCAADPSLRAVLLAGNGPAFTVGGDLRVFARTAPAQLPSLLRRMTSRYHAALAILGGLDVPVVAVVHGSVAGGGLGLLYAADIVLAAEGTKFAAGFGALGLSGDGGNSWHLPRLVGTRRAAEFYFEQRVLDASEAAEWGLVSRVVPAEGVQEEAQALARRLATGPTQAYGEIRRLLRDSATASLAEQFAAETDALARCAATTDATGAIRDFVAKTTPTFRGR